MAALLHDLGHWPFCHAIEDLRLPGVPQHEMFANSFLLEGEIADALQRGLAAATIRTARTDLVSSEKLSGGARQQALKKLAAQLNSAAPGASDQAKVRVLASAVTELAGVRQ